VLQFSQLVPSWRPVRGRRCGLDSSRSQDAQDSCENDGSWGQFQVCATATFVSCPYPLLCWAMGRRCLRASAARRGLPH
jgi:hypothetical protein